MQYFSKEEREALFREPPKPDLDSCSQSWEVKWGSANTTTLFQAPIRGLKAGIIV